MYPGLGTLSQGVSLTTSRLTLRPFVETDLEALAEIYADRETMQYLGTGATFSRPETWRAIASMLGHWLLRGYGMWAVEERDSGAMVGRVGFIEPEGWPGFELGWVIARSRWAEG